MSGVDEGRRVCLEITDFPEVDRPWLVEKAQVIEEAMSEQLSAVLLWHSVVAEPEFSGFRVFFEINPAGGESNSSVPETLVGIIREVSSDLAG